MPSIRQYDVPFVIVVKKTTVEIIPRNKRLREFYDKKRKEGKPFKVTFIACANKLLHWIYALLKNNTTFQDLA
jgi:transposase